jgi:hypothetical protein
VAQGSFGLHEGEGTAPAQRVPTKRRRRSLGVRVSAVVVFLVGVGAAVFLVLHQNSSKSVERAPASGMTAAQLSKLPTTLGHVVYWAGVQSGYTYEVTRTADGSVYIRYLPPGIEPGDANPNYLTIGTYPVKSPVAAVRALAKRAGASPLKLSGGGTAAEDAAHPDSVYVAYPGSIYEIEVYEPVPGLAKRLVLDGKIGPLPNSPSPTQTSAAQPQAMTAPELAKVAGTVGHDVYWAGKRARTKLEETTTSDGRVYVRYLDPSAPVGTSKLYLTIGSYPDSRALADVKAIAKRVKTKTFSVPGGGVAVVDKSHPSSVYIAYPNSDVQVEVFDPSGAAKRLVAAGNVQAAR